MVEFELGEERKDDNGFEVHGEVMPSGKIRQKIDLIKWTQDGWVNEDVNDHFSKIIRVPEA